MRCKSPDLGITSWILFPPTLIHSNCLAAFIPYEVVTTVYWPRDSRMRSTTELWNVRSMLRLCWIVGAIRRGLTNGSNDPEQPYVANAPPVRRHVRLSEKWFKGDAGGDRRQKGISCVGWWRHALPWRGWAAWHGLPWRRPKSNSCGLRAAGSGSHIPPRPYAFKACPRVPTRCLNDGS